MKRIICVWLVLLLVFSSTALADEIIVEEVCNGVTLAGEEDSAVEPRFTYLQHVSIGLTIDENGHLIYGGSAQCFYRSLRVTITLERSTNQLFWDELASTIKTGTTDVMIEEERDLAADDYFYRAEIKAEVLDANRNVLESVTYYSDSERY